MTVSERWLFEIPVYRIAFSDWVADLDQRVERRVEADLQYSAERGESASNEEVERLKLWADRYERRAGWRFNEVIAWIGLLWDGPGPVIKGYAWVVERNNYRRGFIPHPFTGGQSHKVLEVRLTGRESDDDIYREVRDDLAALPTQSVNWLRRRHLDLRCFDSLGPHLRWRQLVGLDALEL